MEDIVSQIENASSERASEQKNRNDLYHEICLRYRLARKTFSSFLRNYLKKDFINILYITAEEPPTDYIMSFQRQYPDKAIKVLIPLFNIDNDKTGKAFAKIDYFMHGKMNSASLCHVRSGVHNVQIFGIYTENFSKIENHKDIYSMKNLAEFVKAARKAAHVLKPDIIHAENIPLLMGLELENSWLSGSPIKYVQSVYNYQMFKDTEPFITAVTFANKNEMKRICSDKNIRKNLSIIFNTELPKTVNKTLAYINYILKKYDEYRKNVGAEKDSQENVILKRMDERILRLFPKMAYKDKSLYNPLYYSLKCANAKILYSKPEEEPKWADSVKNILSLPIKSNIDNDNKIHSEFDTDNFKEVRFLNKRYVLREFSQKRIELKFIDLNIFAEEDVNIHGYLDSFYRAPLFFIPLNEYTDLQYIKTVSLAVLKAFELKKNIQVIFNYPKNMNNTYLNSLLDFFESQHILRGKWLALEGKINIPQFVSGADMILIPSDNYLKIENFLFNALKYGCIPVLSKNGFTNSGISDIFDDLNNGCVFRAKSDSEDSTSEYENVFLKALDFYTNNNTCWNPIIKNAMNYDYTYDFETLEKYNSIYEELL